LITAVFFAAACYDALLFLSRYAIRLPLPRRQHVASIAAAIFMSAVMPCWLITLR